MSRIGPSRRDDGRVLPNAVSALRRTFASGDGAVVNAAPVKPRLRGAVVLAPADAGGGDTDHDGTGADSTAVGTGTTASGDQATSVGDLVVADGTRSTVIGYGSYAPVGAPSSVAVGAEATCLAQQTVAVGDTARATHDRCVAIGYGAACGADDEGVIQVDAFEVVPSSGGFQSWIVLADSTGGRWKIGVDTSGNIIPLGAA